MKKSILILSSTLLAAAGTLFAADSFTWNSEDKITAEKWADSSNWTIEGATFPTSGGPGTASPWATPIIISNATGTAPGLEGFNLNLKLVNSTLTISGLKKFQNQSGSSVINIDEDSTLTIKKLGYAAGSDAGYYTINNLGTFNLEYKRNQTDGSGFKITLGETGYVSFTSFENGSYTAIVNTINATLADSGEHVSFYGVTDSGKKIVSRKLIELEEGQMSLATITESNINFTGSYGVELAKETNLDDLDAGAAGSYYVSNTSSGLSVYYVLDSLADHYIEDSTKAEFSPVGEVTWSGSSLAGTAWTNSTDAARYHAAMNLLADATITVEDGSNITTDGIFVSGMGNLTLNGAAISLFGDQEKLQAFTGTSLTIENQINVNSDFTTKGNVAINGTLNFNEDSNVSLSGGTTFGTNSSIDIASGKTVTLDSGTINGTLTVAGAGTFNVGSGVSIASGTTLTTNVDGTFAGTNSGTLKVTGGTTTWTGTNSGGTIVVDTNGTLDLGSHSSNNNLATLINGISNIVSGEGTIKVKSTSGGYDVQPDMSQISGFTGTLNFSGNFNTKTKLGSIGKLVFLEGTMWGNSGEAISKNIIFNTFQIGATSPTTIELSGSVEIAGGKTLTVTGSKQEAKPTLTISGSLDIKENASLKIKRGGTTISGTISGAGTIEVSENAEKLKLSAANTLFTGATTVSAGTLEIGDENALKNSEVTVGGSGTLSLAVAAATVKSLAGSGTLSKTAEMDKITLTTGTSLFTGTIEENVELIADAITGALSVSDGGKVKLNGATLGANITATGADARVILTHTTTAGENVITLSEGAKILVSGTLGDYSAIDGEENVLKIIAKSAIQYNDPAPAGIMSLSLALDTSNDILNALVLDSGLNSYTLAVSGDWVVLSIPEPSAFGLLAGLGALALAGTRRRRKAK